MVKPPTKATSKLTVRQGGKNQQPTSKNTQSVPDDSSSQSSPERYRSAQRGNKSQQRKASAPQRIPPQRTASSSPQRRTASSPQRRTASSPQHRAASSAQRRAQPTQIRPPKPTGSARRKNQTPVARQMIHLQQTTHELVPRAPFCRLVRELIQRVDQRKDYRITPEALDALRSSTESYITNMLSDSYRITNNRKQVTLQPRDVQLLIYLRGPTGT